MVHPVTTERAAPREGAGIVESRFGARRKGENDPGVEVDEVCVASGLTVVHDAVGVVTRRTGSSGGEMAAVTAPVRQDILPEACVAQHARPVVAPVA